MTDVVIWLLVLFCFLCAGSTAWAVAYALRQEQRIKAHAESMLSDGRDELRKTLLTARADLAQFAEQVEDMIDSARRERAKAYGSRGGRPRKEPEQQELWTHDSYRAHLERTGKPLPEVEAQLGLN